MNIKLRRYSVGGGEMSAWTARHAVQIAEGRTTAAWLMLTVLVQFAGGLAATFWARHAVISLFQF